MPWDVHYRPHHIDAETEAEEPTGPVKSAARGNCPNHTTAAGHLNPRHAHPTRQPPRLTRRPHLAPQSRQAGDRRQQRPPGLPQAPVRHNCPLPRAQPRAPAPPPPPAPDLFVPDLQGLAANAVEDRKEAALERVLEHLARGLLLSRAEDDLNIGTKWRRENRGLALVRRKDAALLTSRSVATDSWTWTRDAASVNFSSHKN